MLLWRSSGRLPPTPWVNVRGHGSDPQCGQADLVCFPATLNPQWTRVVVVSKWEPLGPCPSLVRITLAIPRLHKPGLGTAARPGVKRGVGEGLPSRLRKLDFIGVAATRPGWTTRHTLPNNPDSQTPGGLGPLVLASDRPLLGPLQESACSLLGWGKGC